MRVGRIVGAHGLKGQVKVEPLTDFLSRFDKGARLKLRGEWVEVETSSIHKGRPLLKLSGINDATAAEGLQWEYLEGPDDKPELEDDEFLVEDLIGLKAVNQDGQSLGEVTDVLDLPAHEVLVIGDLMVPFVEEFVEAVDFDEETVRVKLIPGMRPGEETA